VPNHTRSIRSAPHPVPLSPSPPVLPLLSSPRPGTPGRGQGEGLRASDTIGSPHPRPGRASVNSQRASAPGEWPRQRPEPWQGDSSSPARSSADLVTHPGAAACAALPLALAQCYADAMGPHLTQSNHSNHIIVDIPRPLSYNLFARPGGGEQGGIRSMQTRSIVARATCPWSTVAPGYQPVRSAPPPYPSSGFIAPTWHRRLADVLRERDAASCAPSPPHPLKSTKQTQFRRNPRNLIHLQKRTLRISPPQPLSASPIPSCLRAHSCYVWPHLPPLTYKTNPISPQLLLPQPLLSAYLRHILKSSTAPANSAASSGSPPRRRRSSPSSHPT